LKSKRLHHAAQQLGQMFCGWQLHWDKPRLATLGSGVLEIDVLTESCAFDGQPIPPLQIAGVLHRWLLADLARYRIPSEAVRRAVLVARLTLSRIPWEERAGNDQWFGARQQQIRTPTLYRCAIACEGTVETGEAVYTGRYDDLEEWPPGWPAGVAG
jgi:hypothetical protein